MTDREIFRKNLNDLLSSSGRMQKDLAEYVGAKTTTVSGWTRGISYPRAEAMEKIAMFFGVPTSRLISQTVPDASTKKEEEPKTDEIRLLIRGLNKLTPEQVEQATAVFRAMFMQTDPDLFDEKGSDPK